MGRLNKEQSRERWRQVRALWNKWDPIGVCPNTGGPIDEYDSYLGETLRLLEAGAAEQEMADYLVWVVGEHMGLGALSIARV